MLLIAWPLRGIAWLNHRLGGKTPGERRGDLPAQFGIVLLEDDRCKHLIRIAARVSGEEGEYVTGDAVLNFIQGPKPIRMP